MLAFVQGEFVTEERATVSVFDRGFRYGDALFEGILVHHQKPFREKQHFERLQRSADFLRIPIPYSADQFSLFIHDLIARNDLGHGIVRIQLSRGVGPRGYAPDGSEVPFLVMSVHPLPARKDFADVTWKLCTASLRIVAGDPLANHKTCSRLYQVCAAIEARECGADESLLLNTNGDVAEGSTSNVFWIENGTVCTSPLAAGALPGVTRKSVLELCDALGIPRAERNIQGDALAKTDGVFLSFTSRGIVEASSLDALPLRRSALTKRLRQEFEALLDRECPAP